MSPDTPDVTPTDAAAEAAATASTPGDAAAPAPKRPRAPRKTAAKTEAKAEGAGTSDETAPAPVEAAAEGAAPAPAPRKRAPRKTVAAASEATDAATGGATTGEPVPALAREPAPTSAAAGEPGASAPAAAPRAAVETRATAEAAPTGQAHFSLGDDVDQGDDGGDDDETSVEGVGGAEPAGAEGEGSRRSRSRRRRRGRRSGSEDAGAERAEGASEAPGEEGAERPPRATGPIVEFSTADAGETFAGVLSGSFDIDAEVVEGQPSIPAKRVLAAEPDAPKLHKVLAQSGIGSRRDMEQLIADGKVTVNGEVAHTGQRISFGDEVRVAGRVVKLRIAPPPARVIAYHKPAGEVVTMDDPEKRPTVFRRLPRLQHGKWQSVGRLDINTEGLLLFTNSGDLANKLMHPRFGVEREYAARVLGTLDVEARDKLLSGVTIDGQPAQFKSIEDGGGEGANRWYRVVITEGRNREVRKLFDAVGMAVSRLIRIRYGSVVLPKGLKRGVWVDLDENDIRRLRQLAGAEEPQRAPQPQPQQQQARGDRGQSQGQGQGQGQGQRGGQPPQQQQPKSRSSRGRDRDRGGDRGADRGDRERHVSNPAPFREPGDPSSIPNPLQQTFDRRAIQQRERPMAVADDFDEDGPIGPIPNPLQQTYDKRGVQGNRSPFAGKSKGGKGGGGGQPKQPDPLQTAVGYIGADAFVKKLHNRGGGGGRGRR
jgi:23S rRNA pseudouridine2605 synthase